MGHCHAGTYGVGYFTGMPGSAPAYGLSRKISLPQGLPAITIPSDMPKRILRDARLAIIIVRRPSNTC